MDAISRSPNKVVVQISRAENLLIYSDKKGKKQEKWRVLIMGSKKKCSTEYSQCPKGNPIWNSEVTLKLNKTQMDPIVLVVMDMGNNPVGQVIVPIITINPEKSVRKSTSSSLSTLLCSELEPCRKCANPSGYLFYRIWVEEYFLEESAPNNILATKRLSLFGWKQDRKSSLVSSGGSQSNLSHSEKYKVPKRHSFFKSNDKSENFSFKAGKTKSLANIYTIDDIEPNLSSDSDVDKTAYFPPDNIYDHVTQDYGWVRVRDVTQDEPILRHDSLNTNGGELEKVEVWSVQPDNGPITGNFTVVMEGSNFTSGLFELTYICIDGLDPVDATTCTEIVSNTELVLTMPPISKPGIVEINLELLDGSKVACSKKFHYIDYNSEDNQPQIFTPRYDETEFTILDNVLDQYEEVLSSPLHDNKNETPDDSKVIIKRDSGMGSFKDHIKKSRDRRKLSDYGSQGSILSDRALSIRRKSKPITMTKMELFDQVNILRKEVADLQVQLMELQSSTTTQITTFKCQLEARDIEIDNISESLCKLKLKLLEDGLTDYLELK